MGGDSSHATTTVAGCAKGHKHGHTGAVIGAFLDPPSGDRKTPNQDFKYINKFTHYTLSN